MKNILSNENHGTPKDFFLWLGVMATLYISSISLVVLLFEYIKILFPDDLDTYVDPYRGAIRFAIASLIVLFPLYVYLTRLVNKDARKYPAKREIRARKWIIYFTLFAAGVTIVIDLIILINAFLGGELTTQFVLKVLTVLLVIGGAFMYYIYDIRGHWFTHEKASITIGGVVALVVLASVISGFFIMGSPAHQRLLRFDQEKVSDLSNIQRNVLNYYQQTGNVPETLDTIEDPFDYFTVPKDPQTDEPYSYEKTGELSFTLCAEFNLDAPKDKNGDLLFKQYSYDGETWEYTEGETCFDRTIDPERYPVTDTPRVAPIR